MYTALFGILSTVDKIEWQKKIRYKPDNTIQDTLNFMFDDLR